MTSFHKKTKDTRVLNVNATKFKVLSHVSERDERSEARAGSKKSLKGWFLLRIGLDTMLGCIELTKETIQREALYICIVWLEL